MKSQIRIRTIVILSILSICGSLICGLYFIQKKVREINAAPIVNQLSKEVGSCFPGQELLMEYQIFNPLKEAIIIRDIKKDCECVVHEVKSLIPAKSSTSLKFLTKLPRRTGKINFRALIKATGRRSSKKCYYEIKANGSIDNVITIKDNEPVIDLGKFSFSNAPPVEEFEIVKGNHPMKWDRLECLSSGGLIDIYEREDIEGKWLIGFNFSNLDVIGDIHGLVKVEFWDKGKKQEYVYMKPYKVNIDGPMYANPKSVLFGYVSQGDTVTRMIRIVHNGDSPVEIIGVDYEGEGDIQTEVIEREGLVSAILKGDGNRGICNGGIRISCRIDDAVFRVYVHYLGWIT